MKKKLAMFLVAMMVCTTVFSGCGDKEEDTQISGSSSSKKTKSSSSEEPKEKDVEDLEYTITFQDKEYAGKYTGKTDSDEVPNGEGTFTYEKDAEGKYLTYVGEFTDGVFSGAGTLDTNNFLIVFNNDDGTTINRVGTYKGAMVDGIAAGEGSFTATSDSGETYTYTGAFAKGTYNGYGERVFDTLTYSYKGQYTDGEFTPTVTEFYKCMGQDFDPEHLEGEYDVNEAEAATLDQISNSDNPQETAVSMVDPNLTYDAYKADPEANSGKVVCWTMTEQSNGAKGYEGFNNFGYVYFAGKNEAGNWIEGYMVTGKGEAENVAAGFPGGTAVRVYGVPLGVAKFDAINLDTGEYTGEVYESVRLAIFKVELQ